MLGTAPGDLPLHLDLQDARELVNASAYAVRKGIGHLVHATIRWDRCGDFVLRDWLHHQGKLLDKLTRWLHRNAVPVSFLWVRELGRVNGPHTHLLLHLPVERWQDCKQFIVESGGFDPEPNVTGEAVKFTGGTYGTKTLYMRAGHLRYLLKSLDPDALARAPADDGGTRSLPIALGIRVDGNRMPLAGKRCGTSTTIGVAARAADGWRELRSVADLRAYLNP